MKSTKLPKGVPCSLKECEDRLRNLHQSLDTINNEIALLTVKIIRLKQESEGIHLIEGE